MTDMLPAIGYIVGGGLKENLRVRLTVPAQVSSGGGFRGRRKWRLAFLWVSN